MQKKSNKARPVSKFNHLAGTGFNQNIKRVQRQQLLAAILTEAQWLPTPATDETITEQLNLRDRSVGMVGLYDVVCDRFIGSPAARSACAALGASYNKIMQIIFSSDSGWVKVAPRGDVRIPWFDTVLIQPHQVLVEVGLLRYAVERYLDEVQHAKG